MSLDSPLCRLPTELIVAVATLLDARSLVYFKSTCQALQNVVNQTPSLKYALELAARGLCDGPPSSVTVARRLELVEAYEEAWRTFSWSEHLNVELAFPPEAPYVSGGDPYVSGGFVILPIHHGFYEGIRTLVVQSVPSPLRGIPGKRWQIDFDFVVEHFVIDATQDLLVVMPRHNTTVLFVSTLSTGGPHALSENEGVLHLGAFRYTSWSNDKHGICGDFLGMITWSEYKALGDRLLIWNWKTGVLQVSMPFKVGDHHKPVFWLLDNHHFVIPSFEYRGPGDIVLDVYQFCSCPHPCPQGRCHQAQEETSTGIPVRSYILSISNVLEDIRVLRFFPDVCAGTGIAAASPPGHFYADPSKRMFGIQVQVMSLSTMQTTVRGLLVPLCALSAPTRELPYRLTGVFYEPFIALGSRPATFEQRMHIPPEKLPPALRGVDASRSSYAVCCGALLMIERANMYTRFPGKLHILAF